MAIGFDKLTSDVNFDWLGEIPGKLEASRIRDVRKQSLANINVNDSKSLMSAGTKLFNAGDFEGGLKLIEQGKGLKQAETAAFSQEQYLAYLKDQQGKREGSVGVGPAGERYDPFFPAPAGTGARAPATGGAPSWLSPDVLKGVPGAPGPRAEAVPDYENAPPYQVAGPVPTREGPLGPAAPGDETFGPIPPAGTKSVIPPGTLPTAPEAPRQAAPPTDIPGDPVAAEAARKAGDALDELKRAPGGAPGAAARQAAYAKARYYLNQATNDNDKKNWWIFNLDRMRDAAEEGNTDIRPLNYGQYKLQESVAKGQFESAEKLYQTIQDNRRKMEVLKPALDRLDAIGKHAAFTTGVGTETLEKGKAALVNFRDWLVKNGVEVPADISDGVDKATTSVRLREAYTSIVNSVIFDKLGSLGAQTSDRDLFFTKETFPSLKGSIKGNQMIIEYYQDVIQKHRELAEKIQETYGKFKDRGKTFDQHEIDKVATAFWKDPKNDVLGSEKTGYTDLGRRMRNFQADNPGPAGATHPQSGNPLIDPILNRFGLGPEKAAQQKAEAEAAAAAGRPPPAGWAGEFFRDITAGSPPRPGPTGGSGTPPSVGGSAGARELTPAQQKSLSGTEVIDEKSGKRFRWTPSGLVPLE
jgi:hypothetical protein